MNVNVLTVSQLIFYIKSILDSDANLENIFLTGEISNFTDHYQSGHFYFSLKDNKSVVKAIMFAGFARRVKFRPQNGMKVIVRGRVTVYEPSGVYQVYVEDMQPDGVGALNLAFEQLKEKLLKEGLFDTKTKKSLPKYPQKVGVITSETGAVFWDIQNVMKRRFPLAEIVFQPNEGHILGIAIPFKERDIDAPRQRVQHKTRHKQDSRYIQKIHLSFPFFHSVVRSFLKKSKAGAGCSMEFIRHLPVNHSSRSVVTMRGHIQLKGRWTTVASA